MTSQQELPPTHRALVLKSVDESPTVETIPTPKPTPGSAIVKIIAANVLPYTRNAYNGKLQYPLFTPLVIGSSAIGRVAAVGSDATTLSPGQLVYVDVAIRGRDDPSSMILFGLFGGITPGIQKLMKGEWKDATYAEYAKVPLENCYLLNEKRLLGKVDEGGLGYTAEDLMYAGRLLVPYGGLRDLDVKVGETVIVAPATGSFGGAAVEVALGLGARVIAAGRNLIALKEIAARHSNVEIAQLKGDDAAADAEALQKFGPADAYLDFSPAAAAKSTHFESCLLALKPSGRACFMGGIREKVGIPYNILMLKSLQLRGRFMYTPEAPAELLKMIDVGALKLGKAAGLKVSGKFPLEEWDKAFTSAEENSGWGVQALITP